MSTQVFCLMVLRVAPCVQTAEEDAAYLGEIQSQVEQLQGGDAGDLTALRGIEAWPQPA